MANLSRNFGGDDRNGRAQSVAMNAVPTIGSDGSNRKRPGSRLRLSNQCTELVFMARKVHIALVAMPGCGLSVSRSRIARNPASASVAQSEHVGRHVISHRSHRGMIGGTSGKKSLHKRTQRPPICCTTPARSANASLRAKAPMIPDQTERRS